MEPQLSPARRTPKSVLPPQPLQAAVVILAFTALLYVMEFVNSTFLNNALVGDGIRPRDTSGLLGVLWAPFLHGSWDHLLANTIPVVVFGFLAFAGGIGPWVAVTLTIWLVSGLGVWLTAPANSVTVGVSGIAFGWLAFLLVRGVFNRSMLQIAIAAVLLFYWGSVLWGVLPGNPGISWQAHLFGAIGGVLAAWMASMANRPAQPKPALPGSLPG